MTDDAGILKKRHALKTSIGIVVLTPSECVEFVVDAEKAKPDIERHPLEIVYDDTANEPHVQTACRTTVKYVDRMDWKQSVQQSYYSFGVRNRGRTTVRDVSAVVLFASGHRILLTTNIGKETADLQPGNIAYFVLGYGFDGGEWSAIVEELDALGAILRLKDESRATGFAIGDGRMRFPHPTPKHEYAEEIVIDLYADNLTALHARFVVTIGDNLKVTWCGLFTPD